MSRSAPARRIPLALALTVLALLAPGLAYASTSIVFSASDYTTLGLTAVRASPGAARAQLQAGLPGDVAGLLGGALIQASAARTRGQQLSSDAFVLGSAAAARRVLASWRQAHGAARVTIGSGGDESLTGSRKRELAEVLWRGGARLGLIVLTSTRDTSPAASTALAYARLAQSYLSRQLPTTAWGKVLDEIGPNGSVSETTALQAFALAYGPLPGVRPPSGGRTMVPSATAAGAWVLRYLPRLSPRLRHAIDRDLGFTPAGASTTARDGAVAHSASFGDPGFHQNASLTTSANHWASVYGDSGHLSHTLRLQIVAGTTSSPLGGADADSYPVNASGAESDSGPYCRIRVNPAVASGPISYLVVVLAHEVFHCFEFDLDPAWASQGDWLIEGMAEWAALSVDPVMSPTAEAWLLQYVANPGTALFSRTYDAIGFWGHAQDTTGSLWPKIITILNAPSDEARFTDAGGDTDAFLSTWGSSPFRLSSGGPPWQMQSPEPPPQSYVATPITDIDPSGGSEVDAAPYTTAQYDVQATEPLLHVSISGHARLSAQYNYTDLTDAWFCTSGPGTCVCPPMTEGETPPSRPLPGSAQLGLSGDPGSGTHGSLTGVPLSDYCKPKPPPNNNQTNNAGTGGDPHLLTFGQDLYDFQAAGEFTLLKSSNTKDLEIQVRQQPFPHSQAIAVNTAVAVRVGGAIVEIDSASNEGVSALVNHHSFHGTSIALAGGGSLKLEHNALTLPPGETPASVCGGVGLKGAGLLLCEAIIAALDGGSTIAVVTWKDGTQVQIQNALTSPTGERWAPALSIQIKVAHGRDGHLEGLLGNTGVPAVREYLSRTGIPYSVAQLLGEGTALYNGFGASWRITQSQSLFTYARGKGTRNYTIAGFPKQTFELSNVPAGQLQAAAQDCQAVGVHSAKVTHDCEYDVAATGNPAFAGGDVPLQTVATAQAASSAPPTPVLHPIDLGAGEDQPRIAYDPRSGDTYVAWLDKSDTSIDVCVLSASAPSCNAGAGPYKLTDPLAVSDQANPLYFSVDPVVQASGEVVILAEADGVAGAAQPGGYSGSGVEAWSSPAGGAVFASGDQGLDDGGMLLAATGGAGDAPSGGAVALDGTDLGVYGNEYPFGSGFTDFTTDSPAPSATPTVDSTGDYGEQLSVDGTQVASIPDPSALGEYMVVTVGGDYESSALPGCPSGTQQATGFGVGVGTPAALQTQAAWSSAYFAPISCDAFSPVLAGGGSSGGPIGLLENEGPGLVGSGSGSEGVYFRAFEPTSLGFSAPVLVSDETSTSLDGADDLSLGADGDGGMYASWLDHRGWVLDYSANPGQTWGSVATLGLDFDTAGDVVVAGLGSGNAELAYDDNGQEYLVPVDYSKFVAAQRR